MGNSVVHHVQTGVIEVVDDDTVSVDGVDQGKPDVGVVKPTADATKHEWVEYATSLGWEVEGMTKAEIMKSLSEE